LSGEISLPDVAHDILEAQVTAWSHAASVHLRLDPRVVFREWGYRGKAGALLLNFSLGVFIGINHLDNSGFTYSPRKAAESGAEPYPKMRKWLAD
jgi:hypothetical protein